MSGLIDAAVSIMQRSTQRIDRTALNVANVSTPGFKRHVQSSDAPGNGFPAALHRMKVDFRPGKFIETGRPLDLAINGDGFFQLRSGDRVVYSRHGGLSLDGEGRLVAPNGDAVQQVGGGDLVLGTAAVTITADGTVLDGSRPLGRIAVVRARSPDAITAIDGSTFAIADDAVDAMDGPSLRQGALEASNVSLGDEMTGMMVALRGADTGARLVQAYDDLLGKAINAFGQAGR